MFIFVACRWFFASRTVALALVIRAALAFNRNFYTDHSFSKAANFCMTSFGLLLDSSVGANVLDAGIRFISPLFAFFVFSQTDQAIFRLDTLTILENKSFRTIAFFDNLTVGRCSRIALVVIASIGAVVVFQMSIAGKRTFCFFFSPVDADSRLATLVGIGTNGIARRIW